MIQPFHPTFKILGFPKSSSSIVWISRYWRKTAASCQPATSPRQCLLLPTSSWVKKSYLTHVELITTKAPEDKLTKMSVPLSIFTTSPRQGNHISNTGIRVKFPYLWLFMQWTKTFAQSKPGSRRTYLDAQTGVCGNKQIQKEAKSKINSLAGKQRFRLAMALFCRNWNRNTGRKMVALKT